MLVLIRMEIVNVYRRGLIRGGDMSLDTNVALSLSRWFRFGGRGADVDIFSRQTRRSSRVGASLWGHLGIYCPSELGESMRYKLPPWIECHPPLRYNGLQHSNQSPSSPPNLQNPPRLERGHNTTGGRRPSTINHLRRCLERSLACPALHNNNNLHIPSRHIPSRPPLAGSKLSGPRTGKSRCAWSAKRAPVGVLAGGESG
ncbi:unnamed protein product [Tuber melanosporum]|uniref:(Perigord truffle) hypothetical protein n=1 Tax=Tuber melanosporum (strain Mel28) TaxID=656061 RepID=D5GHI4_TUBMM|nr:uncharacterized protein GSTUM_00007931001 [Tuber melanosporum]CAZ83977.1 unnamed protein product [Tuber melanosporum]